MLIKGIRKERTKLLEVNIRYFKRESKRVVSQTIVKKWNIKERWCTKCV
jgi:hypothetical protein